MTEKILGLILSGVIGILLILGGIIDRRRNTFKDDKFIPWLFIIGGAVLIIIGFVGWI